MLLLELAVVFEQLKHVLVILNLVPQLDFDPLQHFDQIAINALDLALDQVLLGRRLRRFFRVFLIRIILDLLKLGLEVFVGLDACHFHLGRTSFHFGGRCRTH